MIRTNPLSTGFRFFNRSWGDRDGAYILLAGTFKSSSKQRQEIANLQSSAL